LRSEREPRGRGRADVKEKVDIRKKTSVERPARIVGNAEGVGGSFRRERVEVIEGGKKKPEFKKSDYKCGICDEPYKAGTKHWKSKQKSRIPGISISQNMYNITKDLKERYKSKEDIPKTHRLCAVCYKEKVVPNLPKRKKETKEKETKEKSKK